MSKKNGRKKGFPFGFFLEIGWCFILNKRQKNRKMSVVFVFLQKKILLSIEWKMAENDMYGIKRFCRKRYYVENDQKRRCFLLQKVFVWIKDNQGCKKNKKNERWKMDLKCVSFIPFSSFSRFLFVHALVINHDRSSLFVHNSSLHVFHVMHACIICITRH